MTFAASINAAVTARSIVEEDDIVGRMARVGAELIREHGRLDPNDLVAGGFPEGQVLEFFLAAQSRAFRILGEDD